MEPLTNFDSRLDHLLATNDQNGIQGLIDFGLDSSALLEYVERTKNYSALKTLAAFIDFYTYSYTLTRIFAGAIKEQKMDELEKYLPDRVYFFGYRISMECGKQNVDYELIPKKYQDMDGYCSGLVTGDNDQFFLRYASDANRLFLACAGELGSRKIMTSCGFTEARVEFYLAGALQAENKETIIFLKANGIDLEKYFLTFCQSPAYFVFFKWCVQERLVVFSEEHWAELKSRSPELYEMLQDDV